MAERIEVLLVLNDRDFASKAQRAKNDISDLSGAANGAGGAFSNFGGRVAGAAAALGGIAGVIGGIKSALTIASDFEKTSIALETMTGSAGGSIKALEIMREYARNTAFEFKELAAAAPLLAAISPTFGDLRKNVKLAGDIAVAFGMSYQDAAQSLQRAFSAGAQSADMFRERGVLAAAGFQAGVSYSVEETRKKFEEFGRSLDGAAEKANKTFAGAVSQLTDGLDDFRLKLGEAISPEFTAFLQIIDEQFKANKKSTDAFATSLGRNIVDAFFAFLRGGAVVVDLLLTMGGVVNDLGKAFWNTFGDVITFVANNAVKGLGFVAQQLATVGIALGKLVATVTGNDDLEEFFRGIQRGARALAEGGIPALGRAFKEFNKGIAVTTARDYVENLIAQIEARAAASRKAAQEAKDAADKLTDASTIKVGAQNAGNELDKLIKKVKEFREELKEIRTLDQYIAAYEKLSAISKELGRDNKDVQAAFDALRSTFSKTFDEFRDVKSLEEFEKQYLKLKDTLAKEIITPAQFDDAMKPLDQGFRKIASKLSDSAGFDEIFRQFDLYKILATRGVLTTEQFAEAQRQLGRAVAGIKFDEGFMSLQEYERQLGQLKKAQDLGIITMDEFKSKKEQLDRVFLQSEGLGRFIDLLGRAQQALSEDLATALLEGQSILDSFKNFFKAIIKQIIADIIRLSILQPIIASIFGVFGYTPTFAAGGAITSVVKTPPAAIPGMANGGSVIKNKPYVIGERGPELFVPSSSGTIIPNDQMMGSTTVNYNIQAVDARSFKELVAQDPEFIYSVTRAGQRRLPR